MSPAEPQPPPQRPSRPTSQPTSQPASQPGEQAPPQPGEVLTLNEPEYKFGIGPVVVRVQRVLARVGFDGQPWWHLRASVANGTPERHGGWVDRDLYVWEPALPGARRDQPPS